MVHGLRSRPEILLGCVFQEKPGQADTPLLLASHPYLYSGYVTVSLHFIV